MRERFSLLVVDENEDDCLLYRRALSRNTDVQYAIEEASDGDSALRRISVAPPDCVLLGYSLPGRNGLDVLKRIRTEHAFVPVLMLTGQGGETVAGAAIQHGAQNCISKAAVNPEHIHCAIQIAVAHCAIEKRLHERRMSLEMFTRALAHDLKEPVRTVKSFLTILADSETLSDQGRTYLDFIQSAADRMNALIEAVYDFTRMDASAPQAKRAACDAAAILEDVKADIANLVAERGAVITAGPLPMLVAVAGQLRQVFQNLICNSIQHCPGSPIIHVSAEEHPDHWVLGVADNGPGIDAAICEKVFEPFTRMSSSSANGLGMGLAICKRIVESHGGRIWCEDAPTGGAHMLFSLPKASTTAQDSAPATTAPQPPDQDNPTADALATVLVVDDNEASIELARLMLKLRCNILSARSGEEALSILRNGDGMKVDLVLLDINMPRLDGFQVLKEVREGPASCASTPIVMCSTSSHDSDVEHARDLGASGYVEKPPQLEKLRPLLHNLPSLRLQENSAGCWLVRLA